MFPSPNYGTSSYHSPVQQQLELWGLRQKLHLKTAFANDRLSAGWGARAFAATRDSYLELYSYV